MSATAEFTIDELAAETGMTVRNIRAHQSRGLLPPPEVRARTGYYVAEHVARLRLIAEMQADGFNLRAIKRLIESSGSQSSQVLDLTRTLMEPFESEASEVITREELVERFGEGDEGDIKRLARAQRLGLIVDLGEGRYEIPSPSLLRAGEQVVALGIPLEAALRVVEKLRRSSETVSRAFIEMVVEYVWEPFDERGRPEHEWAEIAAAVGALRPLAAQAMLASFETTMTSAVEARFGALLEGEKRRRR